MIDRYFVGTTTASEYFARTIAASLPTELDDCYSTAAYSVSSESVVIITIAVVGAKAAPAFSGKESADCVSCSFVVNCLRPAAGAYGWTACFETILRHLCAPESFLT